MKILVVEDELIIGMDLVMLLEDWGHMASGPHTNPKDTLEAIEAFDPDLALLDVNLGKGLNTRSVADALVARDIPFAYLTGYGSQRSIKTGALPEVVTLIKPVPERDLKEFLAEHDHSMP